MRLLLVEDEQRMAAALQRGLAHAGFSVDVAHDGVTGLRDGERGPVRRDRARRDAAGALRLRDHQRLRAQGVWTPILLASAKDGEYDQADGLDLGADDYIVKPFAFVVLLARLRALMRRTAGPRPVTLVVGDLELDPAARTVAVAGSTVDLTAREFAMLEYLMRRPGVVVTKAELLTHVWDTPDVADNAVEVYAGYLRRKLGREHLETVRGAGYRLRDVQST